MTIQKLNEIASALKKKFNENYNVSIISDEIIVVSYNSINNELREIKIDINELLSDKTSQITKIEANEIIWDGISRIRSWSGGGKERIYFNVIGVSESLHKRGKVFLELVFGNWVPNMKYQLMKDFANQLNSLELFDSEKVEELYQSYLEQF